MGKPRIIIRPTSMLRKQTGQMWKLLNLWPTVSNNAKVINSATRKANPPPLMKEGEPEFLNKFSGLTSTHITRRQIVLNRHFTEIISDILANSLQKELRELGVTITSIETKAWNKGVRIFYSSRKPFNEVTHTDLNSLITKLRYAISERQLIGRVPLVNFVYDKIAELDQTLSEALQKVGLTEEEPSKDLSLASDASIKVFQDSKSSGQNTMISGKFSAPSDMVNTILGLDYPCLYNEAVSKLERGRAQSARLISSDALDSVGPLVTIPSDDVSEGEDPATRIIKMQKFIVNQRKKKEFLSKQRRKQELLHRDEYKWDVLEDEESEMSVNQVD